MFLLSKNKIEIQDIPIALILDQYLEYLEKRQQMDLEVASEFVTMAAHLMYIKTRMLLSIEDEEAQSEMDKLVESLQNASGRTPINRSQKGGKAAGLCAMSWDLDSFDQGAGAVPAGQNLPLPA